MAWIFALTVSAMMGRESGAGALLLSISVILVSKVSTWVLWASNTDFSFRRLTAGRVHPNL
jgi:hypothetical protein